MQADRRFARRAVAPLVALVVFLGVLVPAVPAQAGPREWFQGLRRWAAERREEVRAGWYAQRAAYRVLLEQQAAQEQARLAAAAVVQGSRAQDRRACERVRRDADAGTPAELSPAERFMVEAINADRAAAGLPALVPDGRLVASARVQSQEMRAAARVFHTARLAAAVGIRARTVSENVGVGQSVDSLRRSFMISRSHRAAILGRFDRVGVGVVEAGNRTWVTQHFLRSC